MQLSAPLALLALFGAAAAHGSESHADKIISVQVTTQTVPTEAASQAADTGCPTVTSTRELCSTCILPACIMISTVTIPCECDAVPTVFLDFPCDGSGCAGASCTTDYKVEAADGTCRPVASVTDYLDTPVMPMPTFGALNSTASGGESAATQSSESSTTAPPESPSASAPPAETVSGNAAGRLAIPFAGWF
ncbi:hypothetical protein F5X68DRAFT_227239 [Plectosphaerella plurivora]|uniref:Uncharacterized protein n=1 Tax=Plectosphaerella plurivora TaxID=936078 RepID=A0A9P9ACC7_9PEZI|nr:hypothetical protein F5X68DRAFT_227239 [Plectosphaerella plurivora]